MTPSNKPSFAAQYPQKLSVGPNALSKSVPLENIEPYVTLRSSPGKSDPVDFVSATRDTIATALTTVGAVLLRGFQVGDAQRFFQTVEALDPEILSYSERSSPRHAVADRVYTSTDHPADQEIVMHSEQSYTLNFPRFICFWCKVPAATMGATPIASNRTILEGLPSELVEKFRHKGVLYRRTYTPGLGVSWQTAFQTDNRGDVEQFCRERDIEFEWDREDRLKTRQYRSAFQIHPVTRELVWFNHALFFHHTSLDPEIASALIDAVGLDNVPTDTAFGDGEAFSSSEIEAMRHAVAAAKRRFSWEADDVLLLDNMLMQHGREAFTGERKILTLMARPYTSLREPLKSPLQFSRQEH